MSEATAAFQGLAQHPGYRGQPLTADWQTLWGPFFPRLYGTKQVTDACLLGLSVREGLVPATMDRAILHLAGQKYGAHVLLLQA